MNFISINTLKWPTSFLVLLISLIANAEPCKLDDSKSCPTGQICMNGQTPSCKPIPAEAPIDFVLPFDSSTEAICTHARGIGSHSWPNAFYAIDLATPYDQPPSTVLAAASGKAFVFPTEPCAQSEGSPAKAKTNDCGMGWGNNVKILHENGYVSFYVHLQTVLIKSGQQVAQGDPIGIEGWTGLAGHRHLHWSVQKIENENQITWDGISVPFRFKAVHNQKTELVSSALLDCAHANIGEVPKDQQPTFYGVIHRAPSSESAYRVEDWLQDFEQLKKILTSTYPNLDDLSKANKLNLYFLAEETKKRIRSSRTKDEAIQALKDFLAAFKDGHLKLDLNVKASDIKNDATESGLNASTSGAVACQKLVSAKPRDLGFKFPTPKELGFAEVKRQASAFPYTTLEIQKKKIGFLRIASFLDSNYPDLCANEWESYRSSIKNSCDEKCQDDFVHKALPNRFLSEIEKATAKLNEQNISALVLDITNNGGGTDWVGAVIRMFADKPILCGQFGFIRHPHWAQKFEKGIEESKEKLKTALTEEEKQKIRLELAQDKSDLREAKKSCDRSGVWSKKSKSNCSIVVKRPVKDCGPHSEFKFTPKLYDGPLYILTNDGTASASEDLVGRFKDSKVGTIIGGRTLGSGCGFTNGGIEQYLKKSGIAVKVPDCARFLRDGTNEVLGIAPNVEIPIEDLKTEEFTKRLKTWFEKKLTRLEGAKDDSSKAEKVLSR